MRGMLVHAARKGPGICFSRRKLFRHHTPTSTIAMEPRMVLSTSARTILTRIKEVVAHGGQTMLDWFCAADGTLDMDPSVCHI